MRGQPSLVCADGSAGLDMAVRVRLVAPLALLSQAVSAALRSRGFEVEVLRGGAPPRRGTPTSAVTLVLDDLTTAAGVRQVLGLLSATPGPSLVLTTTESEQARGALLSAGATMVMSSASSLDDVEASLRCLESREECLESAERERLVRLWEAASREDAELATRLASLSPRERVVLDGLCGGSGVSELAERLGVAETTVRSQVKSILRKLGVRSQLAAVAAVRRLQSPLVAGTTPPGIAHPSGGAGDDL